MPEEAPAEGMSQEDAATFFESESDAAATGGAPTEPAVAAAPAAAEPTAVAADEKAAVPPVKPADKPQATATPTPEEAAAAKIKEAEDAVTKRHDQAERERVSAAAKKLADEADERAKAEAAKSATPATFEQLRVRALDSIGDMQVVDPSDTDDKATITAKEWAQKYPGIFDMVVAVVSKANTALGVGGIDPAASGRLQALEQAESIRKWESDRQSTFEKLAAPEMGGHTDAAEIVDDPAYAEWVQKQSPKFQECANSFDPTDQRFAIEAYKAAKGIVTEAVAKARGAKTKTDGIHSTTLRTRQPAPATGDKEMSPDEAKRLFDEAVESERKQS